MSSEWVTMNAAAENGLWEHVESKGSLYAMSSLRDTVRKYYQILSEQVRSLKV